MYGDLIIGGAISLVVSVLGWLTIATALTPDAADASIRELGTLLTVQFGIIAAMWWNQSASVSDRPADQNAPPRQSQRDANTLNGAAATFTALALIASVFAGSPWGSTASWLCALGGLLLLVMSGNDIRKAVSVSSKQRLRVREIFGLLSMATVAAAFVWHLVK